jgi:hypothetical protein
MDNRSLLDDLERDLRGRLRTDLSVVSEGKDSLYFYNDGHNPFELPRWRLSKRGGEAYRLACQIRDLRTDLGESDPCEASLLLDAIAHHADRDDAHRLGPKRLAAKLAEEIAKLRPQEAAGGWYGAKTAFRHPSLEPERGLRCYEERIVLIRASDPDEAVRLAEEEAKRYASDTGKYLGYVNVFRILDEIGAGAEVFSAMRSVPLAEDEFVTRFCEDEVSRRR